MVDHKFPINEKNYFRYIMEILSSYTDGFCRLCDRIAKKSNEYGAMKTINTKRAIHTEPALAKVKRNKS